MEVISSERSVPTPSLQIYLEEEPNHSFFALLKWSSPLSTSSSSTSALDYRHSYLFQNPELSVLATLLYPPLRICQPTSTTI